MGGWCARLLDPSGDEARRHMAPPPETNAPEDVSPSPTAHARWRQVRGQAHKDMVTSVALNHYSASTPSNSHLASTSLDHTLMVQTNLADPQTLSSSFSATVLNVSWLDASTLAVACRDGSVARVVSTSLSEPHRFGRHQLGVTGMAAHAGTLCTGSRDGEVKFWDLNTLTMTGTLKLHRNVVTAIAPMGPNLFCQSSEDKSLRVWDARSASVAVEFPKQQYILTSCATAAKGADATAANVIVTGSSGGGSQSQGALVSLWDVRNAGKVQEYRGHEAGVTDCTFINDSLFASCSKDTTVKLWGMDSPTALDSLVMDDSLTCCDASPNGFVLVKALPANMCAVLASDLVHAFLPPLLM